MSFWMTHSKAATTERNCIFEDLLMYQCLCCRNETLPVPASDAVAYICPVCWWENDVFLNSPDEPKSARQGNVLTTYEKSSLLEYLMVTTDVQQGCDGSFYPAPWKHYSIFTQNQVIDIVSHCEPVLTVGTNDSL